MTYRQWLLENILPFVNDSRREAILRIVAQRTRHFTLVLENFHHPHNISATIRSAECFGWHDIHVVENEVQYERNPRVNKGADKWMNINCYDQTEFNTPACFAALREQGFQIVATSPHGGSVTLRELDISRKTAIVLGAESTGISDYVKNNADAFLRIETAGFTESLNVSVTAGIVLEALTARAKSSEVNWQLTDFEREEVLFNYLSKLIEEIHLLENRLIKDHNIINPDRVYAQPANAHKSI